MPSRFRLTAVCLSAVALVAVVSGGTASADPVTDYSGTIPAGTTLSGVAENPNAPSGVTGGVADFGTWRGAPVQSVTAYTGASTWASITGIASQGQTRYWAGTGYHVVWSIPLIPADGSDTLANAASGADDANYTSVAQQLVAGGEAYATLRLGWESGGDWYVWSGSTDPGDYVAAYRRAVNAMRSVPGQHFTFDWNYVLSSIDPASLYPGDDYVDYIGADIYDKSFHTGIPALDHVAVWAKILNGQWGLNDLDAFAVSHGKRFSIPEWGLNYRCDGHGGGDDPYFVQQIHDWIATHDVAYADYFDGNDSSCSLFALSSGTSTTATFPSAATTYLAAFGAPTTDDDPPAALPETRMAVLLPIAGAGVLFLIWNRRRRRRLLDPRV